VTRFRRLVAVVAVLAAATAATAAAALAVTVHTLAPSLDGTTATFYGEVSDCAGPVSGYFLVTDMSTGRTYDTLIDWGHADQFSSNSSMTYSEGPFGLSPDTDYAVRAHGNGPCGSANGNTVFFHTSVGPGTPADVGISQSIGANPRVGQLLTLTVTATNGDTAATQAFIKDIMPAGFQYVACSVLINGAPGGFCSWDGESTVVGTIGTFAKGSTAVLSIGVRPTAAGSFVNSVGIGAHEWDPDSSNNFADAPVTVAG
jgi:uncharacterized repeat protein (TIGR01451 family)